MSYCATLRKIVARLIPSSSAASFIVTPGRVSTRTISSRSNASIRVSRCGVPDRTSEGRWRTSITSVRVSTEINIIGNLVGSYNDLVELMALAARGKVTLHTAKYQLDQFQNAIDDLDAGKVRGRAILIP